MIRRTWIPMALMLIGLALIVAGGMTFSRDGWGAMGAGYEEMCDSYEFHGVHVGDESLFQGGSAPAFGPETGRFSSDGMTDGIWVYTLDDDGR